MPFTYEYPRPMLTVDAMVITREKNPKILLIQRKNDPFSGAWALPGGFVDMDEDLTDAALRELKEETGAALKDMVQFGTYGKPGRDPRGRTVSVVYLAYIDEPLEVSGMDDAAQAKWFALNDLPALAFDHELIIRDYISGSSS